MDGTRTHWICICDGWIYDSNSTIILQKSIFNLDLCAQLQVVDSPNNFATTGMAYYFLPTILDFGKNNKLLLNTTLPNPAGYEYHKMRQCDVCISKKSKIEFSKKQWKSSNTGTRKCKDCSNWFDRIVCGIDSVWFVWLYHSIQEYVLYCYWHSHRLLLEWIQILFRSIESGTNTYSWFILLPIWRTEHNKYYIFII